MVEAGGKTLAAAMVVVAAVAFVAVVQFQVVWPRRFRIALTGFATTVLLHNRVESAFLHDFYTGDEEHSMKALVVVPTSR